jgi:hypothetical protein
MEKWRRPLMARPDAATSSQHDHILWLWTIGVDRLRSHPSPPGFSPRAWHQFRLDAQALLQSYGLQLAALGWSTIHLFGLHRTHPVVRVDASGVARFLHGGTVIGLSDMHVRIRRPTGSELTYRRIPPQPGVVPAWELHPETKEA